MKYNFGLILLFSLVYFFPKHFGNESPRVFYKKNFQGGIEVLLLKANNSFEYYGELNRNVDLHVVYSQGLFQEIGGRIIFKNSFSDSITLNITEKKIPDENYDLYKYIKVAYNDNEEKMMDLSFFNYDRANDPDNQDNIFLCLLDKKGLKRYKMYDFNKKEFGKIYYENEPLGFYLTISGTIISKISYIKNPHANYFDIGISLDSKDYIYHYKENFLNNSVFIFDKNVLINQDRPDSFILYSIPIPSFDIREIAEKLVTERR